MNAPAAQTAPDIACSEAGLAADEVGPRARCRDLILKQLGVARVAGWCGVPKNTVHQWLTRGTDAQPIPVRHVPAIVAGAREAGLDAPMGVLWPAMAPPAEDLVAEARP